MLCHTEHDLTVYAGVRRMAATTFEVKSSLLEIISAPGDASNASDESFCPREDTQVTCIMRLSCRSCADLAVLMQPKELTVSIELNAIYIDSTGKLVRSSQLDNFFSVVWPPDPENSTRGEIAIEVILAMITDM